MSLKASKHNFEKILIVKIHLEFDKSNAVGHFGSIGHKVLESPPLH